MNKNEFISKCKLDKISVSNLKLTSICRIIVSSCFPAFILSASTSITTTSKKTIKTLVNTLSKHNLAVKSEAKQTREEIKGSRYKYKKIVQNLIY